MHSPTTLTQSNWTTKMWLTCSAKKGCSSVACQLSRLINFIYLILSRYSVYCIRSSIPCQLDCLVICAVAPGNVVQISPYYLLGVCFPATWFIEEWHGGDSGLEHRKKNGTWFHGSMSQGKCLIIHSFWVSVWMYQYL